MGNASLKTHASLSVRKKRGMRSFSAKSRPSCALRRPNARRESASCCSRLPRGSKRLLAGPFRKASESLPGLSFAYSESGVKFAELMAVPRLRDLLQPCKYGVFGYRLPERTTTAGFSRAGRNHQLLQHARRPGLAGPTDPNR